MFLLMDVSLSLKSFAFTETIYLGYWKEFTILTGPHGIVAQ